MRNKNGKTDKMCVKVGAGAAFHIRKHSSQTSNGKKTLHTAIEIWMGEKLFRRNRYNNKTAANESLRSRVYREKKTLLIGWSNGPNAIHHTTNHDCLNSMQQTQN